MTVVILLASAACAFAQQPTCQLKKAPEFSGFRLGMTLPEVKGKLADSSMFDSKISEGNKVGTLAVRVSGAELKDEYAEGIDDIHLSFVDNRLAVIRATYYSGAGNWLGAKDFFKQLSEKLGLPEPSSSNTTGSRGSEKYKIACTEFNVTLAYSFGVSPGVTIADSLAQEMVNERVEKESEGKAKKITISPGHTRRPLSPFQPL
jgi:hypothetical protein